MSETLVSKYTLGPWSITDLGKSKRGNPLDASLNGPNGLPLMFIPFTSSEQVANARLIAAAPELLEACRTAIAQLSSLHPLGEISRAETRILAAIAKAEGSNQ